MNRLRLLVIGAALITGGSALASAQTVRQDVAYHDRDRDRRDARDRDDRRLENRYRDDHRIYRDYRVEGRYEIGARRWYGGRWQHWDGRAWCY
jgi:hypothetical protein